MIEKIIINGDGKHFSPKIHKYFDTIISTSDASGEIYSIFKLKENYSILQERTSIDIVYISDGKFFIPCDFSRFTYTISDDDGDVANITTFFAVDDDNKIREYLTVIEI